MSNGVYIIRFRSGHFYIGSTNDFPRRKSQHLWEFRSGRHTQKLQALYTTPEDLQWDWIACNTREHALDVEARYIERYLNDPLCCNTLDRNNVGSFLIEARAGLTMSDETKAKIGAGNRGKVYSAETREKMSLSAMGKLHTPEAKAKIAEANGQKVMIDGIVYNSFNEAGRILGVLSVTVAQRCRSPKARFASWKLL